MLFSFQAHTHLRKSSALYKELLIMIFVANGICECFNKSRLGIAYRKAKKQQSKTICTYKNTPDSCYPIFTNDNNRES